MENFSKNKGDIDRFYEQSFLIGHFYETTPFSVAGQTLGKAPGQGSDSACLRVFFCQTFFCLFTEELLGQIKVKSVKCV